jgi:hypothetical protein
MIRIAIFWALLALVLYATFRRGDRETRLAAVICLAATLLTILVLTPTGYSFAQIEVFVAAIDVGTLLAFVFIALRSPRFWPLWVSGFQLTTVLAHLFRLLQPGLVDLAMPPPCASGAIPFCWC